jgi:hypothetical protein
MEAEEKMRECNNCDRRSCNVGDRLGPLPKIEWGERGPQNHCRQRPKKEADYGRECPVHLPLRDFKLPLIHHLMVNCPQGLYGSLQAVGLQIDPAYNRKGYAVVEAW